MDRDTVGARDKVGFRDNKIGTRDELGARDEVRARDRLRARDKEGAKDEVRGRDKLWTSDVLGLGSSSDVPRLLSPLDAALGQDLRSSSFSPREFFHLEQVYLFPIRDRSLLCPFHCSLDPCLLHPMVCACSVPQLDRRPGGHPAHRSNVVSLQLGQEPMRGQGMVLVTDPLFLLRSRLWIQFWRPRVPHRRESV